MSEPTYSMDASVKAVPGTVLVKPEDWAEIQIIMRSAMELPGFLARDEIERLKKIKVSTVTIIAEEEKTSD